MILFIIYTFLFLCVGGALCTCLLGVSPFALFSWKTGEVFINPFSDWQMLYNDFQHNNWAVDSAENLIIFLVFIFFFPLWIALWFLVRRIPFKKAFLKPVYFYKSHFQSQKISAPKMPVVAKGMVNRPIAMRKTLGIRSIDLTETTTEQKSVDTTPSRPTTSRSNPVSYKKELFELGQKYGYELFERVKLDDFIVPYVLATDTLALVLTVLDDDKEWIADETSSDGDDPTWFSAEGLIPSPYSQMVGASEFLKEKEPDSVIIPVVVLAKGSILNVSNVKEQWDEKGGFVVVWKDGKGEGLDSLENLMREKSLDDIDSDDDESDMEDDDADSSEEEPRENQPQEATEDESEEDLI